MYYLKQVRVFLACWEYEEQFERLKKHLSGDGITCDIYRLWEEGGAKSLCAKGEPDAGDGTAGAWEQGDGSNVCLWITDSAAAAKKLWERGCPVAAFLHAQNREGDFSVCCYALENPEEAEGYYLDRIYRRLRDIPWDVLETKRCLVRETTEEDVDAFYRIYAEPSITGFMENLYEDPEEERSYTRDYRDQVYRFYEFGIWTVTAKKSREVIGRAGICYREGYADPELGFVIAVPWQGQGYATEVCRAILSYARRELHFERVLAFVQPENEVSLHLCKKLGMRETLKTTLQGEEYQILEIQF